MLRALGVAAESGVAEPVTVAQAKVHLGVSHELHDSMIATLISSAREAIERETGVALAEQNWEWSPIGPRREPLPLIPAIVTSQPGDYPIMFTSKPGKIPAALRQAILVMVKDMYDGSNSRQTIESLIYPFRRALP